GVRRDVDGPSTEPDPRDDLAAGAPKHTRQYVRLQLVLVAQLCSAPGVLGPWKPHRHGRALVPQVVVHARDVPFLGHVLRPCTRAVEPLPPLDLAHADAGADWLAVGRGHSVRTKPAGLSRSSK